MAATGTPESLSATDCVLWGYPKWAWPAEPSAGQAPVDSERELVLPMRDLAGAGLFMGVQQGSKHTGTERYTQNDTCDS